MVAYSLYEGQVCKILYFRNFSTQTYIYTLCSVINVFTFISSIKVKSHLYFLKEKKTRLTSSPGLVIDSYSSTASRDVNVTVVDSCTA